MYARTARQSVRTECSEFYRIYSVLGMTLHCTRCPRVTHGFSTMCNRYMKELSDATSDDVSLDWVDSKN